MDWQTLFLKADGRIGRRDFWIGFLIIFVASIVLNMVPVLGQIAGLLLLWPQVCIHAKRLHDMGKTAWLMLIPLGVAIVCGIAGVATGGIAVLGSMAMSDGGSDSAAAAAALSGAGAFMAFMGLAMLVGIGFLLWVGLTPGQPGENQYGPPPKSLTSPAPPAATP